MSSGYRKWNSKEIDGTKKILTDGTEPTNKYISLRLSFKPGTQKTKMSIKCKKIFPTENIKITYNPEDLTGSSEAFTQVASFSRSDENTKTK